MGRRFHAATFIVSRTCLFKNLLQEKAVFPWFAEATQNRETTISQEAASAKKSYWNDEADKECEDARESSVFIRGLGRFCPHPPRKALIEGTYPNSGLIVEPFYIPANWRITPAEPVAGTAFTARLRIHLHQHGVCTASLYCQITNDEPGWAAEEFVKLLRGMVDDNKSGATVFTVITGRSRFSGTADLILKRAIKALVAGLFRPEHRDDALMNCCVLEPDHLLLDVGKTSPQLSLPEDNKEIARLLALSTYPHQQVTHERLERLGLFEEDWIGANKKHFLFCDTAYPWPARIGDERRSHPRGARRSLRKRARVVWRMFRAVELVRSQICLAKELSEKFRECNLKMTQAQHRSEDLWKTLLKPTFYDDRLFTLALDIPAVNTSIYGRDKKILDSLAKEMGLADVDTELQKKVSEFEKKAKEYVPGFKRLVDLVKPFM